MTGSSGWGRGDTDQPPFTTVVRSPRHKHGVLGRSRSYGRHTLADALHILHSHPHIPSPPNHSTPEAPPTATSM
jgi:hypothetical protein